MPDVIRHAIFRTSDFVWGPWSTPIGPIPGPLMVLLILTGLYIGVVMIGGEWMGRRLIDRMSEKTFLRIVEILLVLFGLQFLLWPSR